MTKVRAILLLYTLLFPLGFLLMLPSILLKMVRRGKYRDHFGQRFSLYSEEVKQALASPQARTWIHAVSVGEVFIALKFLRVLQARDPNHPVVLTTTTTTGYALARQRLPQSIPVLYHPLDFPWFVHRALELINPRQLILVESEIWPQLLYRAHRWGTSIALINARLSPRSARRYERFRALTAPLLNLIDPICVQEEEDVARWQLLGIKPERIEMMGSIKFDLDADPPSAVTSEQLVPILKRIADPQQNPILLAASTHPGEEKAIAQVYQSLATRHPDLRLVLVPRHVERTPEIERELASLGLPSLRRSLATADSPTAPCLLVDTTGELRQWISLAHWVVMGKSFLGEGGQNPVEAVGAGKPVLFGPHMENFAGIVRDLLSAQGAVQVEDFAQLEKALDTLIQSPSESQSMATRGQSALAHHCGATQRTLQKIDGE